MQRLGRGRLDAFVPRLLAMTMEDPQPNLVLERVLPLVEAMTRRSTYLMLLTENLGTLKRLLTLCTTSPMVAEQIARFPILPDELPNEGRLFRPPQAVELTAELRERLMRIPKDNLEQQMETLRHFKLAHGLQVAASGIAGTLPLMKVNDYLAWLAETILVEALELAWRQLVQRHGQPLYADGMPCDPDFVIVGYGKVGGLKFGHGSDLDLVFICDGDPHCEADGDESIDGAQFFTRLGQKVTHFLTAQTPSGILYGVDMRLRPSGTAGLLVSSLDAFRRYQEQEAWTRGHQALIRARMLAGCRRVQAGFKAVRAEVLVRPRDLDTLHTEVSEMRAKIHDSPGTRATVADTVSSAFEATAAFDFKHDAGGIIDIEFTVRYAVLAWSGEHPALLEFADSIHILEELERAGLIASGSVHLLQEAYEAYRAATHRLALQKEAEVVSGEHSQTERQEVVRI